MLSSGKQSALSYYTRLLAFLCSMVLGQGSLYGQGQSGSWFGVSRSVQLQVRAFSCKNVTDSDKSDDDDDNALHQCRNLQLPFFSFPKNPQNLFLLSTYIV